jgi:hypothetical protein
MLSTFKTLLTNQYEAVFCTLNRCIVQCPDEGWDAPVIKLKFCQVSFHVLFFADYYLSKNPADQLEQPFHTDHKEYFRDYEELEDRQQVLLYDRPTTREYLEHCRQKACQVVATESEAVFEGSSGFPRRDVTRAELHVMNIRHIHHHAAQLSVRLGQSYAENIPWFGTGWTEVG